MTALASAAAAVLAPILISELVRAGAKLQTRLVRVAIVWVASYAAAVVVLAGRGAVGVLPLTIFWGGTFLSWFGVRSHVESSILIRMLVILRRGPVTDAELVERYLAECGESRRLDELCRGGFLVWHGDQLLATAKGERVVRIVAALR